MSRVDASGVKSGSPGPGSGSSSAASSPVGTPTGTNPPRSRRLGIGALSLQDTIKKKGEDELDHSNYMIMRQLGNGAFSAVWCAFMKPCIVDSH